MQRPSPWFMLVVLLLGLLCLREPRLATAEEWFLGWLLKYAQASGPLAPLTVVEIGGAGLTTSAAALAASPAPAAGDGSAVSPLELALFLQSVLDFQPAVVGFENVLQWREGEKDKEQVFLDQAMRMPKLLLASELGANTDPDAPWADIKGFSDVTGKRGELAIFTGVARQPSEDLRLVSTPGFANLPPDVSSGMRVPLLFLYRGEVIPAFALQAVLHWLKVAPAEVKIVFDFHRSHIILPQGRRIPIRADGTLLINPNAAPRVRRLSLNELLLAAQERDSGKAGEQKLADLKDQIVIARTGTSLAARPDAQVVAIATIQEKSYLRRVTPFLDYAILLLIVAAAGVMGRLERMDLVLCGVALTAAYCLIALGILSRWNLWVPCVLPLGALWVAILLAVFFRQHENSPRAAADDAPVPLD